MVQRTRIIPMAMLVVFGFLLLSGCAGTKAGGEVSDDPVLIQKQIGELDRDMRNTEEMIKGSKAQLQMEDNQVLRDELRSLEMNLIHLESQKRALEERLAELEASGKS